jgi:hypothetical protein
MKIVGAMKNPVDVAGSDLSLAWVSSPKFNPVDDVGKSV